MSDADRVREAREAVRALMTVTHPYSCAGVMRPCLAGDPATIDNARCDCGAKHLRDARLDAYAAAIRAERDTAWRAAVEGMRKPMLDLRHGDRARYAVAGWNDALSALADTMGNGRAESTAEIAALKADGERLDWLEGELQNEASIDGLWVRSRATDTLREAIDATRASETRGRA